MHDNYADRDAQPVFAKDSGTADASAVSITGVANKFWVIDWISWSYSAAPTGGGITVVIGGTTVWHVDITAAGPGHLEFVRPIYTNLRRESGQPKFEETVVVNLLTGGAGVNSKLNVRYR